MEKKKRKGDLESFAGLIGKLRARFPEFGARLAESQALQAWERVVGTLIAKHSRAIAVRNAILIVEVDHPAWRSELHLRRAEILARLNSAAQLEGGRAPLLDLIFVDARPNAPVVRKSP